MLTEDDAPAVERLVKYPRPIAEIEALRIALEDYRKLVGEFVTEAERQRQPRGWFENTKPMTDLERRARELISRPL
jgi:hypothetical protein